MSIALITVTISSPKHNYVFMYMFGTEITDWNVKTFEMIGVSNSREHQKLRRIDGAAAEYDFLFRELAFQVALRVDELDADGSNAVENDPINQNVRFDLHVGPEINYFC